MFHLVVFFPHFVVFVLYKVELKFQFFQFHDNKLQRFFPRVFPAPMSSPFPSSFFSSPSRPSARFVSHWSIPFFFWLNFAAQDSE